MQKVILIDNGVCDTAKWQLVFEDNFEGDTLDLKKWHLQTHSQRTLTNSGSQEYNTLDNVVVKNGICKIIAKKETVFKRTVLWMNDSDLLADGIANLRTFNFTSSNIWSNYE